MKTESSLNLEKNYNEVKLRIEAAARRAGRDAGEIKLIAVSKTHPALLVSEAAKLGLWRFGENKIKEAELKIAELRDQNFEWHLIGHLQSNKARRAVKLFDVIHTLDSIELAERLERICEEEQRRELRVLIQVDLAREAAKSGIAEEELPALAEYLRKCIRLKFEGLMILPPYFENTEDVRPFFKKLRALRDDFRQREFFDENIGELSMGMSHDFEAAIEEGATILRLGTVIFGAREDKK